MTTNETQSPAAGNQKPKTKSKGKIIAFCGLILALIVGGGFWLNAQRDKSWSKKIESTTAVVTRRDLKKELILTGKILPASSAAVFSPVSGQLKEVMAKEGSKVTTGQILFSVIQDSSGQLELQTQRIAVQKALLEYRAEQVEVEKRKSVADLFSDVENNKAETALNSRRLEYDNSKQRLALLEDTLGLKGTRVQSRNNLIYIKAPRDGVVTYVSKSAGESILASIDAAQNNGREVMIISDTRQMMVRSRILEADLAAVKRDQKVTVRLDAFRQKTYEGRVDRISQQGIEDEKAGYTYFVTDIAITQPDADVRSQMNASINMVLEEKKNVLTLPVNAVASMNGNSVVKLVPKSRSEKKESYKDVKIGIASDQFIEVLDLAEGDKSLEIDFATLDLKLLAAGKLAASKP